MLRVQAFIPIALAGSLILVSCSSSAAPSEEFPGLEYYTDFASYEAQVEWSKNRHRAVESLIRDCMANEGFEYALQPFIEAYSVHRSSNTREEVARRGVGLVAGSDPGVSSDLINPNDALVNSLPPEEQLSWLEALAGAPGADGGCMGQASEEVNGPWMEAQAAMAADREELWEQIEADPATVEADAAWASCMAAAGYDAANPRELYLVVERELAWFLASDQPDEAELARAQNQEIQIALQGFDCEEPLRSTYRTVRLRYEEQFFNEHALLLATIRAEIEKVEP